MSNTTRLRTRNPKLPLPLPLASAASAAQPRVPSYHTLKVCHHHPRRLRLQRQTTRRRRRGKRRTSRSRLKSASTQYGRGFHRRSSARLLLSYPSRPCRRLVLVIVETSCWKPAMSVLPRSAGAKFARSYLSAGGSTRDTEIPASIW